MRSLFVHWNELRAFLIIAYLVGRQILSEIQGTAGAKLVEPFGSSDMALVPDLAFPRFFPLFSL